MKFIHTPVNTLVAFTPNTDPKPVLFIHGEKRIKIDNILEVRNERHSFSNCLIYKCTSGDLILELRWDKGRDLWFLDKI